MKKWYYFTFLLLTAVSFAQEDAWVYFNNKPNAQYYLDNPLAMLSQRALDRRTNQNIAINIQDVPIHQSYVDQIEAIPAIEVKAKSKWMNAIHVRGSLEVINGLAEIEFVHHIEYANKSLNISGRNQASAQNNSSNSINKVLETQIDFAYGNSGNQAQMLNLHQLHQQNFTGSGKIIAVMDAGFPGVDTANPFQRLRDNNLILGGYNFVGQSSEFYTSNSHGTLVLSTMGGYVENQLIGTAPDAQYYLFITEDAASENPLEESYWVEAAEMADYLGADIINTSLGYFQYDNPNYNYTYANMDGATSFISRGTNIAFSKGMICVSSAGNSGSGPNPYVAVPADALHGFAVGAVKADETYATFSSIGPTFDQRIKPDVMAQGQGAVVSSVTGTIGVANGTSFSGPIMAGAIASFWQAIPWATNQQVLDFIRQSADRYANPTSQFGYGIPDFQTALNLAQLSVNDATLGRFLVYPNPVAENLKVSFPNHFDSATISIFNNLGQLVLAQNIQSGFDIDLESFSSGIYLYTIKSRDFVQTGKLIKK
ncbi:S8 family serine peptidase [Flavobacterium sp.]|uniref:S8 family serine peptidase n=1 Tax=Flavobacterium sp. TaxID=239 RepID=UPI0025DE1488|nr:S8 family serine peptidase [Flavobacterium sp.]